MLKKIGPLSFAAFLIIAFFLFQQPINAQSDQSLEDMLQKGRDYIAKAKQSGVPLGTVSILSNNSHTDSAGVLHVVGEVYNDMAPNIASDVQVIATFYGSGNKVVGTNNSFTTPRNIASGEKAPFDLIISSASIPIEEINHYELKVDWLVK